MHDMKTLVVLILALGFVVHGFANEMRCPPLTHASLPGAWEAIEAGPIYTVFQMTLPENGDSVLLQITEYGNSKVLRLHSQNVADGKVRMVFRSDESVRGACGSAQVYTIAPRVVVEGEGLDCGPEYALLRAKVTLAAHDGRPERVLNLNFIRSTQGSVTERARRMAERGKALQENYFGGRHSQK